MLTDEISEVNKILDENQKMATTLTAAFPFPPPPAGVCDDQVPPDFPLVVGTTVQHALTNAKRMALNTNSRLAWLLRRSGLHR